MIELIPPGQKVVFTRDYSGASLTDLLRQKLATCRTADQVMQCVLELAAMGVPASAGTHRKWSRLGQKRMEAIDAERAARAAEPRVTLV